MTRRIIDPANVTAAALRVVWRMDLPPLSPRALARVNQRWDVYRREAKARGKTLFNGRITCFVGAKREGGHVVLELAGADYKTFLVTVLRDRPWFLRHAPASLRRAVGNSVLLTHGDSALLGLRSKRVSAYANRLHLLGGVLDALATPQLPANGRGIVAHLKRELAEEAGVSAAELAPHPRLLAIIIDDFLGQPELLWQWETKTPLEVIADRLDSLEHIGHAIVPRISVSPSVWRRMTPVARAAWQRWHTSSAITGS